MAKNMRLRPYRDPLLKYWAVLPDDLLQRVLLYYQLSRSGRRCPFWDAVAYVTAATHPGYPDVKCNAPPRHHL